MATDNRTNGWGWAGLILVAGLFGAGVLYQREGGRLFGPAENDPSPASEPDHKFVDSASPPVADRQTTDQSTGIADGAPKKSGTDPGSMPPVAVRTKQTGASPGTVNVTLKFFQPGSEPLGPWLYIKSHRGQTRDDFWKNTLQAYGTLPEGGQLGDGRGWRVLSKTLPLAPGDYSFEAVVEGYDKESSFPLRVQSQQVKVLAGQTSEITISFPTTITCSQRYSNEFGNWSGGHKRTPQDVNAWVAERETRIRRQVGLYQLDPLVDALKRASDGLGELPPKKPTTLVNLREQQGGPRELDARQVRMLVRYLEEFYWQDLEGENLGLETRAFQLPNSKQIFDTLKAQDMLIEQLIDEVRQLNALARKLEQAPTP